MTIRGILGAITPPVIINRLMRPVKVNSEYAKFLRSPTHHIYSQYGEDLVIDAILEKKDKGFYVDVGAHDPEHMNNTRRFYERGWNGINVEPNPTQYAKFASCRPRDINLNLGIGSHNGVMEFYLLDPDTLSSFDKESIRPYIFSHQAKLIEKKNVEVRTLATILDEHAPTTHIDFMCIDVEGLEVEVIQGNDWERYRPELVVIEINHKVEEEVVLMRTKGYELVFGNCINLFFLDGRSIGQGE